MRAARPSSVSPELLPPFIGRGKEREFLSEALARGERLLCIGGLAGMGKSRLAQEFASTWSGSVVSESLRDVQGAEELAARLPATEGAPNELFVLDDARTLDEAGWERLERWLGASRSRRVLVTSRRRLPLPSAFHLELGPLRAQDAVDLYLERAARSSGGRPLPLRQREAVAPLVDALDRMPLAIELAAWRVRVLPPLALLEKLEGGASPDELLRPPRERSGPSLADAMAETWERLGEAERDLLSQASVFAGGFGLDTAEAVIRMPSPEHDLLDTLHSLQSEGVIQTQASDPPRYSLLRCVQSWARAELKREGRWDAVSARHAAVLLDRAEAWIAAGRRGDEQALRRLGAERENLAAAYQRCLEDAPERVSHAAWLVAEGAALTGRPTVELGRLDDMIRRSRRMGEDSVVAKLLDLRAAGRRRLGQVREARDDLEEALRLASRVDPPDLALQGRILAHLGALRAWCDDHQRGRSELAQALLIARRQRDGDLEAYVRLCIGIVEESRGAWRPARRYLSQAVDLSRRGGNRRLLEMSLFNLGGVLSSLLRQEEARVALEEAHGIATALGRIGSEADILLNLGSLGLATGRHEEAEAHSKRALSLQRRLGNRSFEGIALCNLGILALEQGDLRLARTRLRDAFAILYECGQKRTYGTCLAFLAATEAMLGAREEARRHFQEARSWLVELHDELGLQALRLLEALLDPLALQNDPAPAEPEERARFGQSWEGLIIAQRLLARVRQQHPREPSAPQAAPAAPQQEPADADLLLGPDAVWFRLSGREAVDIGRRGPLRRLLLGLVEQRLLAPGVGLSPERALEVGWPEEQIHPAAALNRVYNAVRELRALGLDGILKRHADGYFLDATVTIARSTDPKPPR